MRMPVVGNTSTTSKGARNSPTAVSIPTKITLTHNDISREIAPRRSAPASILSSLNLSPAWKNKNIWGAARLSETSGCGKLNRNRRYRDDSR